MQKNAEIIVFPKTIYNEMPEPERGAVAVFIHNIRPLIVFLFRLWMVGSATLLIMLLGGCDGLQHTDKGNGVHEITYTDDMGALSGNWEGIVGGVVMNEASKECPAGYQTLGTKITQDGATKVMTQKVRCQ